MATVTKLKAAVNNKNLPILGPDGNLYNYYMGRYTNKLNELGYSLTSTEILALNALVDKGIEDGWIDKVMYLLPFIGSEANPLTGMVPLIDQVSNYELAEETVNSNLFSYNNGKIICMGNNNSLVNAEIPVNTTQFGPTYGFAPFVNVTLDSVSIQGGVKGVYTFANDGDNVARFTCRKGYGSKNDFYYGMRLNASDDTDFKSIQGSAFDEECNANIFFTRYYNDNDQKTRFKRYIMVNGETTPRGNDMTGANSYEIPHVSCNVSIGANTGSGTKYKVNVLAFMNPVVLTSSDMLSFNRAVFALTTALGRDVPTT